MSTCQQIIFYLLLADSLVANAIAWRGQEWYIRHFRTFSRMLPMTRAWAGWYLILVIWIGYLTF